ncbi:MAG TPA: hypothetical protein VGB79_07705 [Allosphingosinicella sp.]|jgi:hypothetical protein
MNFRSIVAAAALSLVAAPALAQKPAAPAPAPQPLNPDAERRAIAFAETRGRLLYGLDRAAWVASDDVMAQISNLQGSGVRGFIVERAGEGFAVTFYGGPADAPVAYYRGDVRNHRVRGREVFPALARPLLTPAQRRLVAAREAAVAANRNRPCGRQPFNTAVVPPDAPDHPIDVYLLTPQPAAGQFALGGHWRVTVSTDGRVTNERPFARSCLMMGGGAAAPPGARPVGMVVTHLLDPVPTEIHVFTSLAAGMPILVGAGGRGWQVDRGSIRQARGR